MVGGHRVGLAGVQFSHLYVDFCEWEGEIRIILDQFMYVFFDE